MEELINILTFIPYGQPIAMALGTATALMTIVMPVVKFIVHATKTKVDDRILKKIADNAVVKKLAIVGKQLKRFSLI